MPEADAEGESPIAMEAPKRLKQPETTGNPYLNGSLPRANGSFGGK